MRVISAVTTLLDHTLTEPLVSGFFQVFHYFLYRYNQIKNYDFQSYQFKGSASDFTQLVWKESGVIGFGSNKGADGTFYLIAYYSPAGNNETLGFADNVNRVTGAGDLDTTQSRYFFLLV